MDFKITMREEDIAARGNYEKYVKGLFEEPRIIEKLEYINIETNKDIVQRWMFKRGENGLRLADIFANGDDKVIIKTIENYVKIMGIPNSLSDLITEMDELSLEYALTDALITRIGGTNFTNDAFFYDNNTYDKCINYIDYELMTFIKLLRKKDLSIDGAEKFFCGILYGFWEELKSEETDRNLLMLERRLNNVEVQNPNLTSIDNVDNMTGVQFEELMYDIFSRLGYAVERTKTTGDQGVDLKISDGKDLNGVVQCKRYTGSVGNTAVQEILAGAGFYGANVGMVVTNSFFTKSAIELAEKVGIILWDRDNLASLLLEIY